MDLKFILGLIPKAQVESLVSGVIDDEVAKLHTEIDKIKADVKVKVLAEIDKILSA